MTISKDIFGDSRPIPIKLIGN